MNPVKSSMLQVMTKVQVTQFSCCRDIAFEELNKMIDVIAPEHQLMSVKRRHPSSFQGKLIDYTDDTLRPDDR